ncbi:helix-turn-helix domain-containing protein [Novosphingobium lentum]|uniref:helix-turn-helix domain-containing protein n=1 Tax=Novosphingobium lentum TaxID=145287 RepID=UPI000833AA33|nr:helix-turn-helix domain-containing protein [Novosphingobium lentum]
MEAGAPDRAGNQLRRAREQLGLDFKQLAATTRINARHLEAIENGDFASLPGRTYVTGFSRSYARAVGLDENAIADAVREEMAGQQLATPARVIHQFEVGDPDKTPSVRIGQIASALAVAVIAVGLVFWRGYYAPAAELPALVGPVQSASAVPGPARQASSGQPTAGQPGAAPAVAPAPGGAVAFTALEPGVWVKFYDGAGVQLMQKQMAQGETYVVPAAAHEPKVWTARPDALSITVAGRAVPKLADQQKIVKDVPVTAEALLARAVAPPATPAPVASATATM